MLDKLLFFVLIWRELEDNLLKYPKSNSFFPYLERKLFLNTKRSKKQLKSKPVAFRIKFSLFWEDHPKSFVPFPNLLAAVYSQVTLGKNVHLTNRHKTSFYWKALNQPNLPQTLMTALEKQHRDVFVQRFPANS